jgi:urease accessory protein
MSKNWPARLQLAYRYEGDATRLQWRHEGPLRVLKTLQPEGRAVCHTVIVHPPGGIVEGDCLDVTARVGAGAHAVVTTPGATRFYRCERDRGTQTVHLALEARARLEWLPLEAIVYPGAHAHNALTWTLAPDAELIAWDVVSLGLPAAGAGFAHGVLEQTLSWPGVWREQGRVDGADARLLTSPVGLGGHACAGTLIYACGTPMAGAKREALLEQVRERLPWGADVRAAATSPDPRLLLVRALAPLTEPIMAVFESVRGTLRQQCWSRSSEGLRSWRV